MLQRSVKYVFLLLLMVSSFLPALHAQYRHGDRRDHYRGHGVGAGRGALIGGGVGAVGGALLGGPKGALIGGAAGAGVGAYAGHHHQRTMRRHYYERRHGYR